MCEKFTYLLILKLRDPSLRHTACSSLGAVAVDDPQSTFYVEFRPLNDEVGARGNESRRWDVRGMRADRDCNAKDAMIAFRDWLHSVVKGEKPVFVGFNATFDWAFVNFYFHQYLGENPFGFGGLDIKSYYMGMTGCTWEDTRSQPHST